MLAGLPVLINLWNRFIYLGPDSAKHLSTCFRFSFQKDLARSELSLCLTALLSAQQTSDGAACAAAVLCQVPRRLQNCGMKNIFINLAPSTTGALVPGSEMSQSFCREEGCFHSTENFLSLECCTDERALLQSVGQGHLPSMCLFPPPRVVKKNIHRVTCVWMFWYL